MKDEKDMFVGQGWEKEIKSLEDPHISSIHPWKMT
jgi:hypothetical protein